MAIMLPDSGEVTRDLIGKLMQVPCFKYLVITITAELRHFVAETVISTF